MAKPFVKAGLKTSFFSISGRFMSGILVPRVGAHRYFLLVTPGRKNAWRRSILLACAPVCGMQLPRWQSDTSDLRCINTAGALATRVRSSWWSCSASLPDERHAS